MSRTLPLSLLVAGLAALACAPEDRDVRLARLAAEQRALAARLDDLEGRFVVTQARVRFWRELRTRNESIDAVACASHEQDAEEMALQAVPEPRSTLRRSHVATFEPGAAGAVERARAE